MVRGRCFAFVLVSGRFLFSRMAGGCWLISIWLVAHGRWFLTMLFQILTRYKFEQGWNLFLLPELHLTQN